MLLQSASKRPEGTPRTRGVDRSISDGGGDELRNSGRVLERHGVTESGELNGLDRGKHLLQSRNRFGISLGSAPGFSAVHEKRRSGDAGGGRVVDLPFVCCSQFVGEEELGIAHELVVRVVAESVADVVAVGVAGDAAQEYIGGIGDVSGAGRGDRRRDHLFEKCDAGRACRFRRGLKQQQAGEEIRVIERGLQSDASARGVSYPIRTLHAELAQQSTALPCVVGEGQVPVGSGTGSVAGAVDAYDAKPVERRLVEDVSEPVAEQARVDQQNRGPVATVPTLQLDVTDVDEGGPGVMCCCHAATVARAAR